MPAITDVPGVLVGHAHDEAALSGCTVVLTPEGATGGVDVRGGAPGTRETDLLDPSATVNEVHAVALCGGSAFGLASASGAMQWLAEHGIGLFTPARRVPIVPAAVIYDLRASQPDVWANGRLGYAACAAAGPSAPEGCVGVGMGATVGKLLGPAFAMKSGVGTWSETLADGTLVGALAVCNAFGDVYEEASGRVIAGVRHVEGGALVGAAKLLRQPEIQRGLFRFLAPQHTTLAVVATDALLTKAEAHKLAQMAQDGLARTIRPVHTPFDGDVVFALATGRRPAPNLMVLGTIAADVLARAIERSAREAVGMGGLPAARDLQG
ncbi:MAG TPA: P1 family peptidase [Roseiflexaceae bacterium]|nr:P1 family peptidase [Roseiflexaceae bacterium]